jgi:hypothetical protein
VPISILIGERRMSPWSLPTVGDDVGNFGQDRRPVIRVAWHDQRLSAAGERTNAARLSEQHLDLF